VEVSDQLHAPATLPQEKNPNAYSIGGWVGRRTSLDMVAKRKNPCPCWKSNCNHPIHG